MSVFTSAAKQHHYFSLLSFSALRLEKPLSSALFGFWGAVCFGMPDVEECCSTRFWNGADQAVSATEELAVPSTIVDIPMNEDCNIQTKQGKHLELTLLIHLRVQATSQCASGQSCSAAACSCIYLEAREAAVPRPFCAFSCLFPSVLFLCWRCVFLLCSLPPSIPLLVLSGTCEALGPLGGSTPAGSLLSMQRIYLKIYTFLPYLPYLSVLSVREGVIGHRLLCCMVAEYSA